MPSFMNSALFLLAAPALLLQGAHGLRGTENKATGERSLQEDSFNEWLGKCHGANCGGWGDPHLITCDGLAYDCQGLGIFTLMENHVFNIQGTFVDVGTEEHAATAHSLTQGASITNDMMIKYKPDDSAPVLQFSFGDIEVDHDGSWPAENGCHIKSYYHELLSNTGVSIEPNIESCRQRCVDYGHECDKFTYWYDGECYLHPWWADRYWSHEHWTRAVAGDVDYDCGLRTAAEEELMSEEQNAKATRIGRGCPLLMFVNGEMIDISDVYHDGDLYGEDGDDIHAELISGHWLRTTYKLDNGDWAVVELRQAGDGLGEMWSCHWDFWICLPESYSEQFSTETVGLLGTPNGNTRDDWMDTDGNTIDFEAILHPNSSEDINDLHMINYCYDNWCVGHDESLMTYHGDHTYEDYKCENEEYIEIIDRDCVLSMPLIEEACADMPPLMIHACEVDCCFGGCNHIQEVVDEIIDTRRMSDNEEDVLNPIPDFDDCRGDSFEDTSDTVCPGDEVVTLLKTVGSEPLPAGDIFYGITLDVEPTISVGEVTVRFKVNNPFPEAADVYVKYEKSVSNDFADPHCAKMLGTPSGCDNNAYDIEVLCRDFEGVDPFALVQVYFVSNSISNADSATVDQCCEPQHYDGFPGTVSYTFEVACGCPSDSTA